MGGAIGDALGYAVEFMSLSQIQRRYGMGGIRNYALDKGVAVYSDDTQMTLFTAEGLLNAMLSDKDATQCISDAYVNWYYTQTNQRSQVNGSWLVQVNSLWADRAPGCTCMSALSAISMRASACNDSKGCGGVMRIAPIGMYAASHPQKMSVAEAGDLAGKAAFITHKHPLSTFASEAAAMIVANCLMAEAVDNVKFKEIVAQTLAALGAKYGRTQDFDYFEMLVNRALDLAMTDVPDTYAVSKLGEGWVAEETLAIAVYSVMRHIASFEDCIVCSVNHNGDSDSTGAVAGNIIGAILGYAAIPQKYIDNLEQHNLLVSVADDLGGFSPDEQMQKRYVEHEYTNPLK